MRYPTEKRETYKLTSIINKKHSYFQKVPKHLLLFGKANKLEFSIIEL